MNYTPSHSDFYICLTCAQGFCSEGPIPSHAIKHTTEMDGHDVCITEKKQVFCNKCQVQLCPDNMSAHGKQNYKIYCDALDDPGLKDRLIQERASKPIRNGLEMEAENYARMTKNIEQCDSKTGVRSIRTIEANLTPFDSGILGEKDKIFKMEEEDKGAEESKSWYPDTRGGRKRKAKVSKKNLQPMKTPLEISAEIINNSYVVRGFEEHNGNFGNFFNFNNIIKKII